MSTATFTYTVAITVDLEAWAAEYRVSEHEALTFAKVDLPQGLKDSMGWRTHDRLVTTVTVTEQTTSVTPAVPARPWEPGSFGLGKRPWFLYRTRPGGSREYHHTQSGLSTAHFADFASAKKAADRLNRKGA